MQNFEFYHMKQINIFLTILLLAAGFQVSSQVKKANRHFRLYEYAEAIPYYLKSAESNNADEKSLSTQRLADCYRYTSNFAEARKWYEKAVQLKNTDPVNYFYLGQVSRNLGMYEKAADAFLTFKTLLPDSLNGEQYHRFSVDIQEWLDLPEQARVENIESINSKFSDFGPALYKNGLVFTSDRRKDMLDKNVYGWTNFGFLNLYFATPEYAENILGAMEEPQLMRSNFNQSYHDGPLCFSSDFSQVFITRTTAQNAKKEEGRIKTYLLQIYSASIDKNGELSKYTAFPFNSNQYSVAHPSLSKSGEQIIFSSDMPGGFGGADLYISSLENGKWTEPVNLGSQINTAGNEVFPFWAEDSVLYFSSEGHLGYGGLDIFRSVLGEEGWLEPENLKKPINSSYDDFGIVLTKDQEGGFFSSNRPQGKGSDDIYAFQDLKRVPAKLAVPLNEKLLVSGFVKDKNTLEPLAMATVFVSNPGSEEVLVLKTDEAGKYETALEYDQPYVVKAMKNGYIYDCTFLRTPTAGTETFTVPQDLLLARLAVDQVFTINNIYYDLDKWYIREDAQQPLDNLVRIMKQYPISAELSSHTDSRASSAYNMELSQKRAEAAVRYMVLQGVAPSRISAKGYGETKLVNQCADGVPCSEEAHQANRRTEFKITAIDARLVNGNAFNPDAFNAGDVINIRLLDATFFENCLDNTISFR